MKGASAYVQRATAEGEQGAARFAVRMAAQSFEYATADRSDSIYAVWLHLIGRAAAGKAILEVPDRRCGLQR